MDKKDVIIKKFFGSAVFFVGGSFIGILLIILGILSMIICAVWNLGDSLLKKVERSGQDCEKKTS